MDDLLFWKNWNTQTKFSYFFILIVFLLSVFLLFKAHHEGLSGVMSWEVTSTPDDKEVVIETFSKDLINYEIKTDSFLINQEFKAQPTHVNTTATKIFIGLIVLSSIFGITIISMIKKVVWYGAAMTIFLAWIYFLKLDLLGVFGLHNNTVMFTIMLIYILSSFLFHAYLTRVGIAIRLVIYTIITGSIGWIILTNATITHPFMSLANYGFWVPAVITAIFMIMIGYDVLSTFLTMITQSRSTKKSGNLINFIVVTIIYVGNLLILYLFKSGEIGWKLIYFNPLYLYLISSIVGIWGHKRRSTMFSKVIDFDPIGAFIFVILAIISNTTIYYAYASGNTSLTAFIEDLITYSHLAFGVMFVVYVLVNFGGMLKANLPVHQVLYDPKKLPYNLVRVGALFLLIYMGGKDHLKHMDEVQSGYFNYLGDVYIVNNEPLLAKNYFDKSNFYNSGNHKANFALAAIAEESGDFEEVVARLDLIINRDPSEYAIVNRSRIYASKGQDLKNLLFLQDGLQKFPDSGELTHNIGYTFDQLNTIDSAYHYYAKAQELLGINPVTSSNIIALTVVNELHEVADSILAIPLFPDHLPYQCNRLALKLASHKNATIEMNWSLLPDSTLDWPSFYYLNNYGMSHLGKLKADNVERLVKFRNTIDQPFVEELDNLLAFVYAYRGNYKLSKASFEQLALETSGISKANYTYTAGLFMYKFGNNDNAKSFFKTSRKTQGFLNHINHASLDLALTELKSQNYEEANRLFYEVIHLDTTVSELAKDLKLAANTTNLDSVVALTEDGFKLKFLLYNVICSNPSNSLKLINSISDPNWKGLMSASKIIDASEEQDSEGAEALWNNITSESVAPEVFQELQYSFLKLLEVQNEYITLNGILDTLKPQHINKMNYRYRPYLRAQCFEKFLDSAKAKTQYNLALEKTPFDPNTVIAASNFYGETIDDAEQAYNIIQEAVVASPNNIKILKAFILTCASQEFETFAETALDALYELIPTEEYEQFYGIYSKVLQQAIIESENWS